MNQQQKKVRELLERMPIGQTRFQMKHFIVGDHVTLLHRVRQCALEIDVREVSLKKEKYQFKKLELELALKKKKLKEKQPTLDEIEIQLKEIEIEQDEWKIISNQRSIHGHQKELDQWYEILSETIENVDTDELLENFDEYDAIYWSQRLGKEAAIDIVSSGYISSGNLNAIERLPQPLQTLSYQKAIELSQELSLSMHKEKNPMNQVSSLQKSHLNQELLKE